MAVICLTSPIKGRDTLLLARDLYQVMKKKQQYWIRPLKKADEINLIQKLGEVDWDIPGHRQLSDISQANDIIAWSQALGLINEKRNTWTPLGSVLSKIIEQNQKEAFLGKANLPNPLRLTLKQKIFFLYNILLKEGDFIIRFVKCFPRGKFSASDITEAFYNTWRDISESLLSSREYKYINEGRELSRSLKGLKGSSVYLRAISKLENLTDLGILGRADERKYEYTVDIDKLDAINEVSMDILSNKPEFQEDNWRTFLESKFFSTASRIFAIKGLENPTPSDIIRCTLDSYSKLAGGLGLCRIDELSLLTGIQSMSSDRPLIVEQKKVRDVIYEMNKQYRKLVSLHVDMLGNISYIKIDSQLLGKLSGIRPPNNISRLKQIN